MGLNPGSSANKLTLSGNAVSLAVSGVLNIGYQGTQHLLKLESGAILNVASLVVGALADATANSVVATGSGTQVNLSGAGVIGKAGSQNAMQVTSGASFTKTGSGDLVLGETSGADSNSLTITNGTLSFGSPISSTLVIGKVGDSNLFKVEAGATATTGQARLGVDATSSGNQAIVTGTGSIWNVGGTLRVGGDGSGNSLDILSGGQVNLTDTTKNLWIGYGVNSSNNTVTVSGSGSTLTVNGAGSDVVISYGGGTTPGSNNRLLLLDSGLADVRSVKLGPGGTLQFGDGGASGTIASSAAIIGNNGGGTVLFKHTDTNLQIANTLSGTLKVRQEGSGKTTLKASSNTYTGNTEVAGGTLALSAANSNNIASSPVIEVGSGATLDVTGLSGGLVLASGQTLGGAGTVAGNVTVSSGSTLSPGLGGIGTMLFQNDVTIAGTLALDLNATTADRFSASQLTISPGSTLQFTSLAGLSAASYLLADYTSLAGTFTSVSGLPGGYQLDYNYLGQNKIALYAVPAPGPLPLLGLAGGLSWSRRLRRRLKGR